MKHTRVSKEDKSLYDPCTIKTDRQMLSFCLCVQVMIDELNSSWSLCSVMDYE